jgi:hypothetical protein
LELSSIRQVGIIFPAINQEAKVLQKKKQNYKTKEELEEMRWQVLLLLI